MLVPMFLGALGLLDFATDLDSIFELLKSRGFDSNVCGSEKLFYLNELIRQGQLIEIGYKQTHWNFRSQRLPLGAGRLCSLKLLRR